MSKENRNYKCRNNPKRKAFSKRIKARLEEEAYDPNYMRVQCLYPDCNLFQSYEFHHIRPVSSSGQCTSENGILLCDYHHSLADRGLITPFELKQFKQGLYKKTPIIEDNIQIEKLIGIATKPIRPTTLNPYLTNQMLLTRLRNSDPRGSLVFKVKRAMAHVQLEIAGNFTSLINASVDDGSLWNRFQIDLLAKGALLTANALDDRSLILRARHVLAVNANAMGRIGQAIEEAEKCLKVFEGMRTLDESYAAYLTRNLSLIYGKAGFQEHADDLIQQSNRHSQEDGETSIRNAQNLMLRGELPKAEKLIDKYNSQIDKNGYTPTLSGKIIGIRTEGICACLGGDVTRGTELFQHALNLAQKYQRGHQIGQANNALLYFTSLRFKRFMQSNGFQKLKRSSIPMGFLRSI